MKPPVFDYVTATSVAEAVALLAEHDGAKLLAGGQSLVPMLNFRLLQPTRLVDINAIPGLAEIQPTPDGGVRIGALTRHRTVETSGRWRTLPPWRSATAAPSAAASATAIPPRSYP